MKKRWLSIVLCAVLMIGALSPMALADEELPEAAGALDDAVPAEEIVPEDGAYVEPVPFDLTAAEEEPSGEEAVPEPIESGETAEEEELPAEDIPAPEEPAAAEEPEPAESTEIGEEDETAEPADGEEEPEEPEESEEAEEEEILEEGIYVDGILMDPEDPLYAKYALQMDGDPGTTTFWNYTPRALKNGETLHYGIDVSAWQGSINWYQVAASGVEFVFIRGGYRTTGTGVLMKDARFTEYINGAKAAGLKVGVYIFSQSITTTEAMEEAYYLMSLVSGYSIDLPLVYDLEHYYGGRFTSAGLSRRAITNMCLTFCAAVESAGYSSMVYSNPSMLNNDIYPEELGRLWLAHYTTQTSYSGRDYEYWQCCGTGLVSGIDTAVDLDFWFKPSGSSVSSPTPAKVTSPFSDVTESDWYYDTVMNAYTTGVVKGATETYFNAAGRASRGQSVVMLYRIEGSPAWSRSASYTDLTQDYYKDAIYWASEKGVVNGYSTTEFGPDRAITREELVSILYRLKGSPYVSGSLSSFTDASKVQSWAVNAMIWAVQNKIITGYAEDSSLRPQNNATRAEVCAILMRFAALG